MPNEYTYSIESNKVVAKPFPLEFKKLSAVTVNYKPDCFNDLENNTVVTLHDEAFPGYTLNTMIVSSSNDPVPNVVHFNPNIRREVLPLIPRPILKAKNKIVSISRQRPIHIIYDYVDSATPKNI